MGSNHRRPLNQAPNIPRFLLSAIPEMKGLGEYAAWLESQGIENLSDLPYQINGLRKAEITEEDKRFHQHVKGKIKTYLRACEVEPKIIEKAFERNSQRVSGIVAEPNGISIPSTLNTAPTNSHEPSECGPDELKNLHIHALKLSVRCRAFEENGNISTIGQLRAWLDRGYTPAIKNIGRGSIKEAENALLKLELLEASTETNMLDGAAALLTQLNGEHHDITIESLHLGNRGHQLKKHGIRNLRHLIEWYFEGCKKLPNFGKSSVEQAKKTVEAISQNIDQDGAIDWVSFTQQLHIAFIPSKNFNPTGCNLVQELPAFIDAVIASHPDEVEAGILRDRLIQSSHEKLSLEELGDRYSVTRERIRQIEKKLLLSISDGLLHGEYEHSKYRFSSELSTLWQNAYNAFEGIEELDGESFFKTISNTWHVSLDRLLPHSAFIFAVLTGKATVPKRLKTKNIPKLRFRELPPKIADKCILELPLKRHAEILYKKEGIETVSDLLEPGQKLHPDIFKWLEKLDKSLVKKGASEFTWDGFFHDTMTLIPVESVNSVETFIKILKETLSNLVEKNDFWGRSSEILVLRIFPWKDDRETLSNAGGKLNCPGPTISRVEKYVCERLRDMLIDNKQTRSISIPSENFRSYWKEIAEVYEEEDVFMRFWHALAVKWEIPASRLKDVIHTIYSILTSHPYGRKNETRGPRNVRKTPIEEIKTPEIEPGFVIKLRAKRTVH